MLRSFTLHRPETLAEAIELRRSLGEDGALYAGGTELLLAMKMGLAHWPHLIDTKRIAELHGVRAEEGWLTVGAAATHRQVERDAGVRAGWPALAALEANVANVRVRAAGTLAGNLAFGEPHADPPALLVALGTTVVLAGPGGRREVALEDFLVGPYETSLAADEVIAAIRVPAAPAGARVAYRNFRVLERPSIGVALVARIDDGRLVDAPTLVLGAIDEVPRRVDTAPFAGARLADAAPAIAELARTSADPVDDLAGSAEYKAHVAGVLVRRLLEEAA